MQYSNKAYLLIGGNVGDRIAYLHQARTLLKERAGAEETASSLYETAAWGLTDQAPFLNQALLINTQLSAEQLIQKILKTEADIGRVRGEKFGPRTIDIDILFFNEEIHDLPNLTIPHPQIQHRRFALEPLCEIAPELTHPLLKKSIKELLAICDDPLPVQVFIEGGKD